MKHAGKQALDQIENLLKELRKFDQLREKSRGIFYFKSRSFLHFHEDPAGLFADMRDKEDFLRFPVDQVQQQTRLLKAVSVQLSKAQKPSMTK